MDSFNVPLTEALTRIALAVLFGLIIGWEREKKHKPAGLRTYSMVSMGSAVFTLVTLEIFQSAVLASQSAARVDPLRIVEGIIGGLGFLGAGSIIRSRGTVEGLTTAAGIWVTGAIGLACGGGHYALAGITTLFTILILTVLGLIERRFLKKIAP